MKRALLIGFLILLAGIALSQTERREYADNKGNMYSVELTSKTGDSLIVVMKQFSGNGLRLVTTVMMSKTSTERDINRALERSLKIKSTKRLK